MKSNKYIKFDGLNTDEVKKFLTNGELKIENMPVLHERVHNKW